MRALRLATRGSALARWQAERVASLLRAAHPGLEVAMVVVTTTGDQRTDVPLHELGGQGVFVKEVQQAVLDGRADLAVHSAKDLPSSPTPGLRIAAVPERGDPCDALVGRPLDALDDGAVVATGSVRRRAQLARLRPDLRFTDLRGNIGRRLEKIPPGGAIVMAVVALQRLGLDGRIAEALPVERMCPQVGQGALAVECREDDGRTAAMLAAIDDHRSHRAIAVERAFLAELGSGCSLPVAAHLGVDGRLHTFLAGPTGVFDEPLAEPDERLHTFLAGPTGVFDEPLAEPDERRAAAHARRALASVG